MSSIEEQLERDIAAVTGGVVVTDSDLKAAREAVDERIDRSRTRARRRTWAAVAAAAVVVPVLGYAAFQLPGSVKDSAQPAGTRAPRDGAAESAWLTGDAPTQDQLQGLWRVDNDTVTLRFSPPDLVAMDDQGQVFGDPGVRGTYTLDGDLVTVRIDGGAAGCAGQSFGLRASVPAEGALRVVPDAPFTGTCAFRSVDYWALEELLPTSDAVRGMTVPKKGFHPLADASGLSGLWMSDSGGHALEIDPGGAYYVASGAGDLVDQGTWSLDGADLTLTSTADSRDCQPGDRLVLSGVRTLDSGTSMIRATPTMNSCAGGWAFDAWFLVPDATG
jgi:hypothetical protein